MCSGANVVPASPGVGGTRLRTDHCLVRCGELTQELLLKGIVDNESGWALPTVTPKGGFTFE